MARSPMPWEQGEAPPANIEVEAMAAPRAGSGC
jgi:hypothetical protein